MSGRKKVGIRKLPDLKRVNAFFGFDSEMGRKGIAATDGYGRVRSTG